MPADTDTLETLLLPFASGDLAWPSGTVHFVGARDGWPLRQFPLHALTCEQPFKPLADALLRAGLQVVPDATDSDAGADNPLVLVLLPRQRDHARAVLARAIMRAAPGGRLVLCVANNEGAKAAQADLQRLAAGIEVRTKNHARVMWTPQLAATALDDALLQDWLALDAPRPILDGRYTSRPGAFAWDRIDSASALLAAHLPITLAGEGADLGAGWGFLADTVLHTSSRVTAMHLFEADARALGLARRNLAPHAGRLEIAYHWHDVEQGLPRQFDFIVSNPPFHAMSRDARPDIGRGFIAVAAAALRPGGRLWMVANRHLPYEQVLARDYARVITHAQRDGFKVIEAVKGGVVIPSPVAPCPPDAHSDPFRRPR